MLDDPLEPVAPEHALSKLECVTVSVARARVLDIFLRNNSRHFDHTVVITTPTDRETQEVARHWHASTLLTDAFQANGNVFDAGLPYSLAFERLPHKDWVLCVSSDIILHADFRAYLRLKWLNRDALYGCDRINLNTADDVRRMERDELDGPASTAEWGFGYFQMFWLKTRWLQGLRQPYPSQPDGRVSDAMFRWQFGGPHLYLRKRWYWDERYQKRLSLPCYHLGNPGVIYEFEHLLPKTANQMHTL